MCDQKPRKLVGFYSGYVDAETDARPLTEDSFECDAVLLTVWTTEDDGSDTLKPLPVSLTYLSGEEEVYWGFRECVHQIFPGQTTDYIPAKNARDIFVRRNKNKGEAVRVGFSLFKYDDAEEKRQ